AVARRILDRLVSRRRPARLRYLLEQRIQVFPLEEAIAVHRMADGHDLACVLPVAERVRRNAQILSGLGNSEVVPQLDHVASLPVGILPTLGRPYQGPLYLPRVRIGK